MVARVKPLKTLHITNSFHASSGGIATYYRALLCEANASERPVRIIVPGPANEVEHVGKWGRIYRIAAPRSWFVDTRYRLLLPHTYALPYASRLRSILKYEVPDVVEVGDKYALAYLP